MNFFKYIKTRRQSKKSTTKHAKRNLDIRKILSREYSDSVVVDVYEYCMERCKCEPSALGESNVRDFLLCVLFESEVNNGGLSQFFSNGSGDMSEETVLALERIGEPNTAELLREALRCFPNGIAPKDRDARNDLMEQLDEKAEEQLDKLDQIIWEHSLSQSCYAFLQAHKNDFLCF